MNALVPSQNKIAPIVLQGVSLALSGEIERYVAYQEHDRNPRCVYDQNKQELTIHFEQPFPANEPTLRLLLVDIENLRSLHKQCDHQ